MWRWGRWSVMPARRHTLPHAPDWLLLVGITALICGLSVLAAGLQSPDRALWLATSGAPGAQAASLNRADAAPVAGGLPATVHPSHPTPASKQRHKRVAGDGLGQVNVQRSDERNYVMRTAMARWHRTLQLRNDTRTKEGLVSTCGSMC